MRVLDVHADHCSFETVAAPPAEDAPEPEPPEPDPGAAAGGVPAPHEGGFDDCLAVLVAVEGPDAADPERVAERAAAHLERRAGDLRVPRVVCYPCPPLSERSADHGTTVDCCRALARALPDDLDCCRAPVGWHHALALETAGHPFAAVVSRFDAVDATSPVELEWTVVTPEGDRHAPDAGSLDTTTRTVAARLPDEADEDRRSFDAGATPPPGPFAAVDPLGGRRLGPGGRLVNDLVVAHARRRLRDHGATPVETPATYDLGASDVAALLGACGESWPGAEAGAGGTLRASTRLGVCSLLRDATLSRDDCPVRLTEAGPVRTPDGGATVPTAHAVASDREGAWGELRAFATLTRDLLADCGPETVPVCRIGEEVPASRVEGLAAALDRPVLVGRGGEGAAVDLTFHDPERAQALRPRVRLTPELAARAGIAFDDDGEAGGAPVLVDCTPLGSPDDRRRGLADPAPDWLAPTQVRFVTVDAAHRDRAADLAGRLVDAGLRADVDDRPRPVGERLDRAATDRVPFTVVVGDREADGAALRVHDRRTERERELSPAALVEHLRERVAGYPRREPYGPRFVGEGLAMGTTDESVE